MMKRTTAVKLHQMIADNLVSVSSTVVNYDERGSAEIPVEKFEEDLEFYINSGIFADTIDFTFEIVGKNKIHVAIGKKSSCCSNDMDVTLHLTDGGQMESIVKQLQEEAEV